MVKKVAAIPLNINLPPGRLKNAGGLVNTEKLNLSSSSSMYDFAQMRMRAFMQLSFFTVAMVKFSVFISRCFWILRDKLVAPDSLSIKILSGLKS